MLSTLAQIKSIVFNVSLDDESLQGAYDKGMLNIKLTDQQGLQIGLGIGADLKALLNLNSLFAQEDDTQNQPQ